MSEPLTNTLTVSPGQSHTIFTYLPFRHHSFRDSLFLLIPLIWSVGRGPCSSLDNVINKHRHHRVSLQYLLGHVSFNRLLKMCNSVLWDPSRANKYLISWHGFIHLCLLLFKAVLYKPNMALVRRPWSFWEEKGTVLRTDRTLSGIPPNWIGCVRCNRRNCCRILFEGFNWLFQVQKLILRSEHLRIFLDSNDMFVERQLLFL